MAKQLLSQAIAAPAFYGINTQESGVTLQEGFALQADNCVMDKFGRLGARKGRALLTTTGGTVNDADGNAIGIDLLGLSNFNDVKGANIFISWSADKFYTGTTTLTELATSGTDLGTGHVVGNWQAATLNDKHYFFQRGQKPLCYEDLGGSSSATFKSVQTSSSASGTPPNANTVLAAYGRLWAADEPDDKTKVSFTNVLEGTQWDSGTSGSLDISSVLTSGMDEIVALGAHNGYLIIFCKNNIIIYGDNDNFQNGITTAGLTLVEVIEGVGCVARDSVQNTGQDILFLSSTGIRSLNRTVQEKSQPMRDISKNIRDDVLGSLSGANVDNIKSVYSPVDAFYLITFPLSMITYCFDIRMPLEDGSLRATFWPNMYPKGYLAKDSRLYFAGLNGVEAYQGHQDLGLPYTMDYYSNYFDLGQPNISKIVKKISSTTVGTSGQEFILRIGYDYSNTYYSYPFTLALGSVTEYGIAEYGIGEYVGTIQINNQTANSQGAGSIIQIGFSVVVNGAPFSLQRISLYAKQGKVI